MRSVTHAQKFYTLSNTFLEKKYIDFSYYCIMKYKNMHAKTINASERELEDHEDFCFLKEDTNGISYDSQKSSALEEIDTFNQYNKMYMDEKQIFELRIVNACTTGHLDIIEEYLETHDINNFLHTGWTLLLYAASCAQAKVMKYLIINGADVNRHINGYTPLMTLCSSTEGTSENYLKCLTLLMEAKANANATNKQRQTPLMYACQSKEPEFVVELIKYVKNINTCDSLQQTALMYATIANKPDIVQILIENAADVTLTDHTNMTAKDIASTKGYDKILSLLNCDEEEIINNCDTFKIYNWKDMFPSLTNVTNGTVDFDVNTILYGMGLEKYNDIFQGMNLKTFLKLTENDLSDLGVEINVHRKQFMQYLHRFHRKKWSIQSIGVIDRSLPYTLYDGVISLGTVAKQVAVIGTSFQYIKNGLLNVDNEKMCLMKEQISNYEEEIKKTQRTLDILQKELVNVKALSKNICKKNDIGIPATYIGPTKCAINWPIFLSVTIMVGIYLFRRVHIERLLIN